MSTELKVEKIKADGSLPKWPDDAEHIAMRIDEEEKNRWKVCGFVGSHMLLRRAKKNGS